MGFYGNITNTSKTTFQFDRTYANRNQMQMNAGNDGVYPGRYVLIDYDTTINDDYFYKPDPTNPESECWMWDGQIYTGGPVANEINGTQVFVDAPDVRTKITQSSGFSKGKCVAVPVGQNVSSINSKSIYYQITGRTETGYVAMRVTQSEFDAFMDSFEEDNPTVNTYHAVTLYAHTYEPGVYYITSDGEVYEKAVGDFQETQTYYERAVKQDLFIYVIGNAASDVVLNSTWVTSEELETGKIYQVKKGCSYNVNAKYVEYWILDKDTDELRWKAAADDASTYTLNASIDRAVYGSGRGFDSTVWQKVIKNGRDTYVMIAELNSVVPTFDIAADAPSTIPLVPHFDKDSTNVYYKLHVQPNWAIRTKAARNDVQGPSIDNTGALGGMHLLSIDEIMYPSDQTTHWSSKLYNAADGTEKTVHFNPTQSTWEPNESLEDQAISAAIYFNKAGFESRRVNKSSDVITEKTPQYNKNIADSGWKPEDKIELRPTGLSGKRYDTHNATATDEVQVDTQELSIMLPSLGDAMSHIWDIVYGGRETNDIIRQTHTRNEDIAWENARGALNRNGLRLVGAQDGNAYNVSEVNTLAGCINSVHDLMGMIITAENCEALGKNLDLLNTDRIYYVKPYPGLGLDPNDPTLSDDIKSILAYEQQFIRKQLTYTYDPIEESAFDYEEVAPDSEEFDPSLYYVKDANGNFVTATQADVAAGKTLYKKVISEAAVFDPAGLTPFDGTKYFYQDFTSSEDLSKYNDAVPIAWLKDYVRDDVYHPGHNYFTIKEPTGPSDKTADLIEQPLSGAYEANTYFYAQGGGYLLDPESTPTLGRPYYKIDEQKVLNLSDEAAGGYEGIYVPGKYYIYDESTGQYKIDNEPQGTYFGNQKAGHFAIKKESQDSEAPLYIQETHYIPISYADIIADGFEYELYIYDEGESVYKLYTEEVIDKDNLYFLKEIRLVPTSGHLIIEPTPLRLALYQEGAFFFKEYNEDGTFIGYSPVTPDQIEAVYDSQQQFYVFGVKEVQGPNGTTDLSFVFTAEEKANDPNYACKAQSTFYVPHRYHFLSSNDGKGSYLLDHYETKTHNPYYIFQKDPTPVDPSIKFYEPNKYYTYNPVSGEYEIVRDPQMPTDQPLYNKTALYVIEDTAGVYEKGAEWNVFADKVPATVTLGTREEKYEMVPIPGFARNMNTIHGLILKINQILQLDNKLTRDRTTVQGTLNVLNDIISKFDKMKPQHLLMVDEYGRVQSSDWETQQSTSSDIEKKSTTTYRKGVHADIYPKANSVDEMQDQWITMNVNPNFKEPKITIHHNYQTVKDQPTTSNVNGNGDTIVLYRPIIDKMGHVVGNANNTVTLPYGFKTIKVTNDTTVSAPATTINGSGQIADNTQDTLTFAATNRWVKFDNNTEDTIKVGHLLSPFVTGTAPNTLYGLTTNLSVAQLDTDNTFEVPCLQFDEAGHILEARTHTVTLPENFTTHAITVSDTNNADSTVGTAGNITPDTLTDTLTFAEGNRWINIAADATNDKITFSHYVKNFNETTSALDFNETSNGKTFTVQSIGWDRAGHLISSDKKTFTLPDNFKTLTIGNSGKSIVSFDTATDGNLVADTLVDTATFDIGNRWLTFVANTGSDKVTLYHAAPDANSTCTNTTQTGNETPAFGATFKIPEVKYDEAGHIFKIGTHTVQIPLPSLTQDDSGNVMTGLALSDTEGKFTITKEDLGTLTLGTYSKGNDNGDVAATDTLAQALSKLQTQINDEENARAKAIKDLLGGENINAAFDTIQEIAAWLEGNDSGADGIIDAVATLNGADTVEGSVKKQIKDAIEALDVSDSEQTGKYVSAVSEADGKISVSRKDLPTYTLSAGAENGSVKLNETEVKVTGIDTAAFKKVEDFAAADILETAKFEYSNPETTEVEEQTIAWLFEKIAELENRIKTIEFHSTPQN